MRFTIKELPMDQFKLLGMERKDLINLPPRTLNALLNGGRTSLIRFNNINLQNGAAPLTLDAKLSLIRERNGDAVLKIHPINQAPKNTYGLSDQEKKTLHENENYFVSKTIKTPTGEKEALISLDKTTNEFVAVNKNNINAPEEINGIALNEEQKEDFKSGREVRVGNGVYKFNPNSEIGVSTVAEGGETAEINKLKFKHSTYSSKELSFDMALLASGLGGIVLLEHLANLMVHSRQEPRDATQKAGYWDALEKAEKEIISVKGERNYSRGEYGDIVNKYLSEFGIPTGVKTRDVNNASVGTGNHLNEEDNQEKRQRKVRQPKM